MCNHQKLVRDGWTNMWTGRDEDYFKCSTCDKWWDYLEAIEMVEQGLYTHHYDEGYMVKNNVQYN